MARSHSSFSLEFVDIAPSRRRAKPDRPKRRRHQSRQQFNVIAFSTCWNSGRHTDGGEMLREIVDLGFDRVELGHGIRISLMPGIQKMFESGKVKFSSLHNFCPLPVEVLHASPDCYQFSSPYGKERERAIKQTFQTIDFAERLDAPFVVMHLGEVPMKPVTDLLIKRIRKGEQFSRDYVREKIDAVEKREAGRPEILV